MCGGAEATGLSARVGSRRSALSSVGPHEGVLHDILGESPVAHDQVRSQHRPGLVALYQFLQPTDVALFEARYRSPLILPHSFRSTSGGDTYSCYPREGKKV